jgi:hypothetical protein
LDGFFGAYLRVLAYSERNSLSEQLALSAELLAPLLVLRFGLEDQTMAVEFSLSEDVHRVVCAVAQALGVPVLATHLECAQFDEHGCGEITHGSFSKVVGQDCPLSHARKAERVSYGLEPAVVLHAIAQAKGFATPAHEPTAVEVGSKVKQVADGAFDERNDVGHGNLRVRQEKK